MLLEPVNGAIGTAKYCKINGIDVAAKTGTTNEDYDRWLCGFTPYYTAATWFGFDLNETINFNNKNPSGQIWSSVMKSIHSSLPNREFDIPSKIESESICPITGNIATNICKNAYTEYYLEGTTPTQLCTDHSNVKENVPSLIYGRFNSDKELLLFFDDRIYMDSEMISSNAKIKGVKID